MGIGAVQVPVSKCLFRGIFLLEARFEGRNALKPLDLGPCPSFILKSYQGENLSFSLLIFIKGNLSFEAPVEMDAAISPRPCRPGVQDVSQLTS